MRLPQQQFGDMLASVDLAREPEAEAQVERLGASLVADPARDQPSMALRSQPLDQRPDGPPADAPSLVATVDEESPEVGVLTGPARLGGHQEPGHLIVRLDGTHPRHHRRALMRLGIGGVGKRAGHGGHEPLLCVVRGETGDQGPVRL